MTVKFTVLGGNGLVDHEAMGPVRRRMLAEPVGHQQASRATREHLGPIRRRMLAEPVMHGYPTGGAAPAPVIHYLMIGRRVSDGVWIPWSVTGTPDTTGAQAPSPVVVSTITTTRRWVT